MRIVTRVPRWASAVVAFACFYFGLDMAIWLLFRRMHVATWPAETVAALAQIHLCVLGAAMAAYGFWRPLAFHPKVRPGYRDWLRSTPWHPGMRLPIGPITLAWWDVPVLLAGAALAHWHIHSSISVPVLAFCCGYLFSSVMVLADTFPCAAYALAVGCAFVVRWIQTPAVSAVVAVGLVLLVQVALLGSLRRFPWERDPLSKAPATPGWLAMIPHDCKPLFSNRAAIAVCAALVCWAWSLLSVLEGEMSRGDAVIVVFVASAWGSVLRWAAYWGLYRPTLTLVGRLRTGRLVVRGYDQMLLAPIAAPIVGGVIALGLGRIATSGPLIVALAGAASTAVLLMGPPSMPVWQLTGNHRTTGFQRSPHSARTRSART